MAFTKKEFLDWLLTSGSYNNSIKPLRNILSYYGYWILSINSKPISERLEITPTRVFQINKEFEKKLFCPKIIGNFVNKAFIDKEVPDEFKTHFVTIFFEFTSIGKDLSLIFNNFWLGDYSIDKIKELLLKYQSDVSNYNI
jgi:hypothetical protein